MLLPSGRSVRVGWAPHEILYLEAVNTLAGKEREAAIRDIAGLVGRPYWSVWSKARDLRKTERDEARAILRRFLGAPYERSRQVMVRTPTMAAHRRTKMTGTI